MSLSIGTTSFAAECDPIIAQCRKTISEKNKALELSDLALRTCTDQNASLNTKYQEASESANAWYKNPYIIFPLGFVAGVLVTEYVKK